VPAGCRARATAIRTVYSAGIGTGRDGVVVTFDGRRKRIVQAIGMPLIVTAGLGLVTGCSSISSIGSGGVPSGDAAGSVVVAPELLNNVNGGQSAAPVPGAVGSVRQEDLSPECAAAVAPVRAVMARYPSGLLVTSVPDNAALSDGVNAARTACELKDPQQWADFYANEYFGWLNGPTG